MFANGLSMLWETVEPRGALRERFGLGSFEDAVGWLTRGLAQEWAIDVLTCERIVISDANAIAWVDSDRGPLIAKWSRAEELFGRLTAVAELLHALHERGLPVAPPLASVDGGHRVTVESGSRPLSMMVQPQVDGELLDVGDEVAVRRAGARLAELHDGLAALPDRRLIDDTDVELRQQIEEWLPREDRGLRERIESLPPIDAKRQLIHNDYRASNVLIKKSEVRAIIDFDGVTWDYAVSDLANAFVYLGTHFTDWRPTPASVRATLLDGYESVRRLTPLEHEWLQVLALWRGIRAIPPGDDPNGWADAL